MIRKLTLGASLLAFLLVDAAVAAANRWRSHRALARSLS